ncbi:MAG: bifunctional enoyl-CoA hydratase/phosphate acetyltransferase [Marinibacterium sp.]
MVEATKTNPQQIECLTYDELQIGQSASLVHRLTVRDIEIFAAVTGDVNPIIVDADYAASGPFRGPIAQGMWTGAMFSSLLGSRLPGPGTIMVHESLDFLHPIRPDDSVTLTVTVTAKDDKRRRVTLAATATTLSGKHVIQGRFEVLPPSKKLTVTQRPADHILVEERGTKFLRLIDAAEALPPLPTAIVHPVEDNAVAGAVEAARANLIVPVFVGPRARILAAADAAGTDISDWELIDTEHSDAAAQKAAEMAHLGQVRALMKGSLHTDEFLRPILAHENNLRTDRRLSQIFVEDVPSYPKLLMITDAAINIAPGLETKKDILENAVEMAHALGIETPRVAVLSAVEVVNPHIPSTLDAAALCKMAQRGQISGALVDGPLAFDNAVSELAAKTKHIVSDVAGRADILLAPDLDAGNMISKQLEYLAAAEAAGIVMGARVPVILTSRADSAQNRLASCAVAAIVHAARHPDEAAR